MTFGFNLNLMTSLRPHCRNCRIFDEMEMLSSIKARFSQARQKSSLVTRTTCTDPSLPSLLVIQLLHHRHRHLFALTNTPASRCGLLMCCLSSVLSPSYIELMQV